MTVILHAIKFNTTDPLNFKEKVIPCCIASACIASENQV